MPMNFAQRRLWLPVSVLLAALGLAAVGGSVESPPSLTVSNPVVVSSTIGALFKPGSTSTHSCTASVVDSPSGNLVLTAAHCVTDAGIGSRFVPAYRDGNAPYGSWVVRHVVVDKRWATAQDPDDDVAFLVVEPASTNATWASVQSVVGANVLVTSPHVGDQVIVSGYGEGAGDTLVNCVTAAFLTDGSPTFDCAGFVSGTSGSPWITDFDPLTGTGKVAGIIGGPDQGGLTDGTSYSPTFDADVLALERRAVAES